MVPLLTTPLDDLRFVKISKIAKQTCRHIEALPGGLMRSMRGVGTTKSGEREVASVGAFFLFGGPHELDQGPS